MNILNCSLNHPPVGVSSDSGGEGLRLTLHHPDSHVVSLSVSPYYNASGYKKKNKSIVLNYRCNSPQKLPGSIWVQSSRFAGTST